MKTHTNNRKIEYAIANHKTLSVSTYTYLPRERDYIDYVMNRFLLDVGLNSIGDKLCYCVHEIAGNAKKANTKRIYFREQGLDINDPSHYERGMTNFKDVTTENIGYYLQKQREAGLYIKFHFRRENSHLRILVRNNVEMTEMERSRIQQKLVIARTHDNLADAYSESEDYSEGAGIGIVMLLLMLKNLGFSKNSLDISSAEGCTDALLVLDLDAYSPAGFIENVSA